MAWEKKIQLAKETKAALDPSVGQSETQAMEAEIHRMQLRYAQMQKFEEKMITEMERAVSKREVIADRKGVSKNSEMINPPQRKSHDSAGVAANRLRREISELTKRLRAVLKDIQDADQGNNPNA